MCVLRADYMIDQPTSTLKLVEYNTIASSFGCLSNKVHRMHKYINNKYGEDLEFNYGMTSDYESQIVQDDQELSVLPWH